MKKIWIYSDLEQENERKAVIQLSKKCIQNREVELDVVCFHPLVSEDDGIWNELDSIGVRKVYRSNDCRLQRPYYKEIVGLLKKLIEENDVQVLLFHTSESNKVISAQLQTELGIGLTADCSDFEIQDNMKLIMIRPTYEGKKYAYIKSKSKLQMATVLFQNTEYKLDELKSHQKLEFYRVKNDCSMTKTIQEILKDKQIQQDQVKDVILCGGMGLQKKENFCLLKELAQRMGCSAMATRPVVENGWASRSELIGLSGMTVEPKLYIAFGVSGSLQHMEGVKASVIMSVNTDRFAPICKHSKYVITSDAVEMITKMREFTLSRE